MLFSLNLADPLLFNFVFYYYLFHFCFSLFYVSFGHLRRIPMGILQFVRINVHVDELES